MRTLHVFGCRTLIHIQLPAFVSRQDLNRFQFAHARLRALLIWPFRYTADMPNVYNGRGQMAFFIGALPSR
jgi:hypothetical protein